MVFLTFPSQPGKEEWHWILLPCLGQAGLGKPATGASLPLRSIAAITEDALYHIRIPFDIPKRSLFFPPASFRAFLSPLPVYLSGFGGFLFCQEVRL
jgi:hypothetical protein